MQKKEQYDEAKEILNACSEEQKKVLKLLLEYGSQSNVERKGNMTRMTINRILKKPVMYGSEIEPKFYSFTEGTCDCKLDAFGNWRFNEVLSGQLPPLMKSGPGNNFSDFGKALLSVIKNLPKEVI